MALSRCTQAIIFSVAVHGMIFGGSMLMAREEVRQTERVYRVALADFAQPVRQQPPVPPAPEPPKPETPPPPEPPKPMPPKPEPQKTEPVKEQVRKISPKKSNKKPAKPRPVQPAPQPTPPVAAGPQARTIGGLSAYDSDKLDQRPGITKRVMPEYPTRARRMNVEGQVMVQVVVDKQGMPRNGQIVRATPSGYFEDAALKAVRRMRFTPGRLKGQVVNTVVMIPFAFRLR